MILEKMQVFKDVTNIAMEQNLDSLVQEETRLILRLVLRQEIVQLLAVMLNAEMG